MSKVLFKPFFLILLSLALLCCPIIAAPSSNNEPSEIQSVALEASFLNKELSQEQWQNLSKQYEAMLNNNQQVVENYSQLLKQTELDISKQSFDSSNKTTTDSERLTFYTQIDALDKTLQETKATTELINSQLQTILETENFSHTNEIKTYLESNLKLLTQIESIIKKIKNLTIDNVIALQQARLNFLIQEQQKSSNLSINQAIDSIRFSEEAQTKIDALTKRLNANDLTDQQKSVIALEIASLKFNQKLQTVSDDQVLTTEIVKLVDGIIVDSNRYAEGYNKGISSAINGINEAIKTIQMVLTAKSNQLTLLDKERSEFTKKIDEFKAKESQPNAKDKSLQNVTAILTQTDGLFNNVKAENQQTAEKLPNLNEKAKAIFQTLLNQQLTSHTSLPTDQESWKQVLHNLVNLPKTLMEKVTDAFSKVVKQYHRLSLQKKVSLCVTEAFIVLVGGFLYFMLKRILFFSNYSDQLKQYPTTRSILILVSNNLLSIMVALFLVTPLFFLKLKPEDFSLLLAINLSWVVIKLPISVCFFLMISSKKLLGSGISSKYYNPKLFRLILISGISAWLIGISIYIVNLLQFSKLEIEILSRIFFIWLILMQIPLFKFNQYVQGIVITERQNNPLIDRSTLVFLFDVVNQIVRLVMIISGIVGLTGFVNLAMVIVVYTLFLIFLLIFWHVASGLLLDLVNFIKYYLNHYTKFDYVSVQDVIQSAHKPLQVILFYYIWFSFPLSVGLKKHSVFANWVNNLINMPLFSFGGSQISLRHLIFSVFFMVICFLYAKLSRKSVAYSFPKNTVDVGIRDSSSIFVQYAIMLIGILFILGYLGINLTALGIFAGAIGIAIGFGLQNIANNLVSGILLLALRPLKVGDTVEIDKYVGKVDQIGLRSITMKRSDNTNVIIPNSAAISSSFVNWTYQDDILKSSFKLSVQNKANPNHIIEIIRDILDEQKGVLQNHVKSVNVEEFAGGSIKYDISYYVNINQASNSKVKSEILLNIYHKLAEHSYALT